MASSSSPLIPFDEPFVSDEDYHPSYLPPRSVLPELESYLNESESKDVLRINDEKLSKLTDELSDEFLKEIEEMEMEKSKTTQKSQSEETTTEPGPESTATGGLCAASSPSPDSNKEDKYSQIARILAYNVMNFSFYPDQGDEPWFIESDIDKKVIGKDDEAFAIVECLNRWERSGYYERWIELLL